MIKYLVFLLMFVSLSAFADQLKILKYSKTSKPNEESFFLIATDKGSFLVKSWQFNKEKGWSGKGEPKISVNEAIKTAEKFHKNKTNLGVKEVRLRSAMSKQKSTVWFYIVTLAELPASFNSKEFDLVILTSGQVVLPHKR